MMIYYHHRTLGDGAEGIHIREMVSAFRQLGHTVKVFGPVGEKMDARSSTAGWLSRLKQAMPAGIFELCELAYSLVSFWQLLWAIRRERPAFIYDRYITFNAGPILAAKFTGVPIFLEVNAPLALERSEEPDEKLIFRRIAFYVERWVCANASKTIVVSTPLRDYLTSIGVPEMQCVVMPNGVNPVLFAPREKRTDLQKELGIPDDAVVIGFTGVLRQWHGLEILTKAVAALIAKGKKVFFLVVGDGPARADLELLFTKQGLEYSACITGRVHHSDVPDYACLFDIAVSPKATFYASPMKVIEYMSMSKAVVVPQTKNMLDIVDSGTTGIVFPESSTEGLIEALLPLSDNPVVCSQLGAAARRKVEGRLNWQWNAMEVCRLLDTVL